MHRTSLLDPEEGQLTVEADRPVVAKLSSAAKASDAYSVENTCIHYCDASDPLQCLLTNVCFCGQFCGALAYLDSRRVRPGVSATTWITPGRVKYVSEAPPAPQDMQREQHASLVELAARP